MASNPPTSPPGTLLPRSNPCSPAAPNSHYWAHLRSKPPVPLLPQPLHLPGAPQPAGTAVHPPLHKMPQPVEHHEVERDPHKSEEDAEEAGGHRSGAQVAVACREKEACQGPFASPGALTPHPLQTWQLVFTEASGSRSRTLPSFPQSHLRTLLPSGGYARHFTDWRTEAPGRSAVCMRYPSLPSFPPLWTDKDVERGTEGCGASDAAPPGWTPFQPQPCCLQAPVSGCGPQAGHP